jgi:hypothetical protein
MRNTKTRLQTFNSGHIGEERTPMMPSGCEEKPEQKCEKKLNNQERIPMMPRFPGDDDKEKEQKVDKNKRQPMMPSKE